jgi:EmrB/QacA subfamily drug resistance transporter
MAKMARHEGAGVALETPAPVARGGWILAAVILGSGVVFLDGTVVNVALPRMQADFNATLAGIQWIVDAYALMLAALLLVGGALGDLYGRRRIFVIGLVGFSITSALCGLAPTLGGLIAARALQGVTGALLVPESLAIINAVFPLERRGQAIGTWAAFTGVTSALGPLLGGYLVDAASWRWVFFINIPLVVVTVLITRASVPETRNEHAARHIDWPGTATITLGLGGLIFALIEGPGRGWGNPLVLGTLVVGIAGLVAFVIVEARSPRPMAPLTLFRSRQFSGTNIVTLAIYAALSGALFFLVLDLQQIQRYSALRAGLSLLPFTLMMLLFSRRAGALADRFGPRLPMTVGPAIICVGYLLLLRERPGASYVSVLLPAVLVLAFGMVVTVAPLTTAVMTSVSVDFSGVASGINNATSRIAAALAVAVLGVLVATQFAAALEQHLPGLPISSQARAQLAAEHNDLGNARVPATVSPAQAPAVRQAIDDAFTQAYQTAMLICALLALAGGIISCLTIPGRLWPVPSRAKPAATSPPETVAMERR